MKKFKNWQIFLIIFLIVFLFSISASQQTKKVTKNFLFSNKDFKIIASSENKDLENIITEHAKKSGYNVKIEYDGTLNIIDRLNSGEKFDSVWTSN